MKRFIKMVSEMSDEQVGKYIQSRRLELHLTQEDLLKRLKDKGLARSVSSLSAWESGTHVPFENLAIISEALQEPSPLNLYSLAGVFDAIPGAHILLLVGILPESDQRWIENIIEAILNREGS